MKRKIILNLAMSIDGYIAKENGDFKWIAGEGSNKLNTNNKWSYEEFLEDVDIVVMGKNCYDEGFYKDFNNKKIFVATSQKLKNHDNVWFISEDICKTIELEKEKSGKNIFLFGGGILIDSFIKRDIIDEYIIGIIPTILGKGRPLFLNNNPEIKLSLEEYFFEDGVAILKYSKR